MISHESSIALAIDAKQQEAIAPGLSPAIQRPLPRLESLDSARLFAAAGVVWVHTHLVPGPLTDIGRFGTVYFTLAMVVFMLRHARRNPLELYNAYAYERVCRLTIPFIIWSCVGTLAFIARVYINDTSIAVPRPLDVALATSSPLWFLHFAMLLSILGYPLVRWLTRQTGEADRRVAKICTVIGALFACLPDHNFEWLGRYYYLFERVYEVIPAIFWGVSVDHYLRNRDRGVTSMPMVLIGAVVMAVATVSYFTFGFSIAGKNLAGLGLMLLACGSVDGSHWHFLSRVGRLSFGIYLIHPFAISLAHLVLHLRDRLTLSEYLVTYVFALSFSIVLAWVLRRSSYTRWLVT